MPRNVVKFGLRALMGERRVHKLSPQVYVEHHRTMPWEPQSIA